MARLDKLFHEMVKRGASDMHLTSDEPPRLRVDGGMVTMAMDPLTPDAMTGLLQEIAEDDPWREFQETGDADFAYEIEGLARFRSNYFRDLRGPGAVFRVIPSEILTAEKLGLSPAILKLCRLNKGMVLVTGPTGSGKSTTLCAMIDYINRTRDEHIITIEDPVEFVHPNKKCLINQREIGNHTESFKKALRAALREDPDIILVGELRDLETVAIALEMAETGHLVFGTLHTTTAHQTVDRIVDQFPPDQQEQIRVMLAGTLRGVVSQTLLKKIGGGRVAAMEVLINNTAVAANIRDGKTHQIPLAMQTGGKLGMVELNTALLKLVDEHKVHPEEAYLKAIEKDSLERELRKRGHEVEAPPPPKSGASTAATRTTQQVPPPRGGAPAQSLRRAGSTATQNAKKDPPPWSLRAGGTSAGGAKKKGFFS